MPPRINASASELGSTLATLLLNPRISSATTSISHPGWRHWQSRAGSISPAQSATALVNDSPNLEVLPGFLPPACCPKVPCEQGRAVGLKRELVGPAKPKRRERSEGQTAVRLA